MGPQVTEGTTRLGPQWLIPFGEGVSIAVSADGISDSETGNGETGSELSSSFIMSPSLASAHLKLKHCQEDVILIL
jgi:hypothetical protein